MGVYRHHNKGIFSPIPNEEKQKVLLLIREKILEKHLEYEKD
jgi:hypothetical protein